MSRLTTTSYAVLGQLALATGTAYELTKRMRRNYRFFWPRAESRLYDEARRLVDAGLATSERSFTGRRARTRYALTPAGRRALKAWLAEPPAAGWAFQYEPLLRVFLGSFGTQAQLLAAIEKARADADELLLVADAIAADYAAGTAEGQPQVDVRALVFDFLFHQAEAIRAWSDRARAEVDRWADADDPAARAEAGLARIAELAARRRAGQLP
jgi:PadR family transcriptional regulator, regulatory protein AphA